jgi:hypothetical protein
MPDLGHVCLNLISWPGIKRKLKHVGAHRSPIKFTMPNRESSLAKVGHFHAGSTPALLRTGKVLCANIFTRGRASTHDAFRCCEHFRLVAYSSTHRRRTVRQTSVDAAQSTDFGVRNLEWPLLGESERKEHAKEDFCDALHK